EDRDLLLEGFLEVLISLLDGLVESRDHGGADLLALLLADPPGSVAEGQQAAAEFGVEGSEEDVGDVGGLEAGALVEAGDDGGAREAGVHEDVAFAGADEGGG